MKNFILSFLLISMIGVQTYAYTANIDGIYYNLSKSDKIATVTYYEYSSYNWFGYKYISNINIPSSITYEGETYEVTRIGIYAFGCCSGIKNISIPNSVTSIGSNAFKGCTSLTSISIPNSVTSIENNAFEGCTGLTNITIGNSVTEIGNYVFSGCNKLTYLSIPNSVTSIGGNAFENCSKLKSIIIPNSVTSIGSGAFYRCTSLTSIPIPNSVTTIKQNTFNGCLGLKSVTIPNSITSIGKEAFSHCDSVESFTFGTGVVNIDESIFYGHTPCKIIWLANTPPYGYEKIQGKINYVTNENYSKLDNKIIFPYLSSIFESEGIKYVPINPSERTCEAIDCVYDNTTENLTIGEKAIYKGIEMNVKSINPYVFYGNFYLKNVKWEYGGKIPKSAFQNCKNLLSIKIANRTENIEDFAFAECLNLTDVDFGCGVLTIGNNVFENCKAIQNIVIPKNIARIYDYTFKGCSNLKSVNIEEPKLDEQLHKLNFDKCIFDWKNKSQKNYEFDVVSGDILAFAYTYDAGNGIYGGYLKIDINNSNILNLKTSIRDFYMYKFEKDQHVKLSISFDLNVPANGSQDYNSASISNIEVGNEYSLTLGSNKNNSLFADCPIESVHIGRNINYIATKEKGYSPFYNNKSLSTVFITNKETKIYEYEFFGCVNLKNIIFGDDITTIENKAFAGCISLEKIICGSKLKTIGQEAFANCTGIKRFICHAITPPTCGTQALDDINKWECTLSVPKESIAIYQQTDQWKEFFFINDDVTGISKLTNRLVSPNHIYDLNGRNLKEPKKGINIIGGKKVLVK